MRLLSAFISPPYIRPARFRTTMTLGAFDLSSSLPVSAVGDTVSAWSVAGSTIDAADIASSLFESSLLPYLILLYFLSRTETNTPKLANFGFQFLLVFVFATIPAGIYAKIHYQDILANVDWLHGFAESFLTLTNLFIIAGFRRTRLDPPVDTKSIALNSSAIPIAFLLTALSTASFIHPEPLNALSIPTWIVHTSSLLEWLVAMKLIWEHADTSGNPRWKGMTLAMIPSHVSTGWGRRYSQFRSRAFIFSFLSFLAFIMHFDPPIDIGDMRVHLPLLLQHSCAELDCGATGGFDCSRK